MFRRNFINSWQPYAQSRSKGAKAILITSEQNACSERTTRNCSAVSSNGCPPQCIERLTPLTDVDYPLKNVL